MVDFEKVFGEDGSGDFSLPKGSDTGVNSIYFLKGNLELQGTLTKEWTNTYAKDKYGWIEFFAGHIEMPNGQIPYVNVVANGINGQDPNYPILPVRIGENGDKQVFRFSANILVPSHNGVRIFFGRNNDSGGNAKMWFSLTGRYLQK
jgi:hypothetical protein